MQDALFDLPEPPPRRVKRKAKGLELLPDAELRPCKFCGAWVVPAYTKKGNVTMADPDTKLNHWLTCAKRDEAREFYAKERRRR